MATNHIAPSFTAGVALHRALTSAGAECTISADVSEPRFIDLDTPTVFWFGRRYSPRSNSSGAPWHLLENSPPTPGAELDRSATRHAAPEIHPVT
ncbi:hypothetical protein [Rhodococcus artemisiae]|uniref:Uncharacterized protein n=1 Tax=Rhodococcus artemisiae TaxID=714159 RepID=A0ABU7LJ63_9NOCA|nr:hypothetical protein [Rhodococcus artemisiae]MEE2061610.1 hypothetical protein [Rhodococcus artemisiae]